LRVILLVQLLLVSLRSLSNHDIISVLMKVYLTKDSHIGMMDFLAKLLHASYGYIDFMTYFNNTHICLTALFRDYPGEPVPER